MELTRFLLDADKGRRSETQTSSPSAPMKENELTMQDEKKIIEDILGDCELHYRLTWNMFSSRADFDAFLEEEVRFHAKMKNLDFQKAKEAYIAWAEEKHYAEYNRIK
jgi:hypothetical protein